MTTTTNWTSATTPPPVHPRKNLDGAYVSDPVLCSLARVIRLGQPPHRWYAIARYHAAHEGEPACWLNATFDGSDLTDSVVGWQAPEAHPPIEA